MVDEIKKGRQYLQEALAELPVVIKVYPSDANFLLVEVTDADQVYDHLLTYGIVVRNRTNQPGCYNCLRISVGTEDENKALVEALRAYAG
jgi:histidinol-phosphate aminotransferase